MRRIDELHLELPFYGSRRMAFELTRKAVAVNRKRVRLLMRAMGIEALVPRPGTPKPRLRRRCPLPAARPEDCRAQPRVGGRRDLHPVGARRPLSGRVSDWASLRDSRSAPVEHQRSEYLARRRWPMRCCGSESRGLFIPDQGLPFTADAFTGKLVTAGVESSMDGRGRSSSHLHRTAVRSIPSTKNCS